MVINRITKYPSGESLFFISFLLVAAFLASGCYTVDSLKRSMPKERGAVVAPSEGHVLTIVKNIQIDEEAPLELCYLDKKCSFCELTPFIKEGSSLVVIFMKVYHKHITVSPIKGRIRQVHYVPGGFRNVFVKDAYKENEHNSIVIEGDVTIGVIQIAGTVARKILCDVTAGDEVEKGDKLGHIKLGSAVAILLPPECTIAVKEGQKVDTARDIIATYPTEEVQ